MQQKILLLASFVKENWIEGFLKKIKKNFGVKKESVFFFRLDDGTFLLTYKIRVNIDHKIDIKKELPKTIQIHKKGNTIFTINALNRLIEEESGLRGNVNHKEYVIDWTKYDNKIILLKGDVLEINKIERVFLYES